jgi:pilus assembly protein CpaF
MGVIERVSRSIALGGSAFDRASVSAEAERLLRLETPWRADAALESVVSRVVGLGPIQHLIDDPDVTDVLVNGWEKVWVDRGTGLEPTSCRFESDEEVVTVVERAIAPLGLRIDRSMPMVDARLGDGSRLHAVLPPASVDGVLVAVRRFSQRVSKLADLVDSGTATTEQVDRLVEAVAARRTIVVSGGTGTGKTTLLNLLGAHIPQSERVVTIEDAAELSLPGHVVRLEAHPPNSEGVGEITIRQLIRSALRLRPDRIIVGEVRGPEALDLISALNTGHRGSMTTVHANSPEQAMWRIETLAMTAGVMAEMAIRRQLNSAVDMVVQMTRVGGRRTIESIVDRRDPGSV